MGGAAEIVGDESARLRNDAKRDANKAENTRAGENRRRKDNSQFIRQIGICGTPGQQVCLDSAQKWRAAHDERESGTHERSERL